MEPDRRIFLLGGLLLGIVMLMLLSVALPDSGYTTNLLIDKSNRVAPFPFTFQSLMWIIFCVALGELGYVFAFVRVENESLRSKLLPQNPEKMLSPASVEDLVKEIRSITSGASYLPKMIEKSALQFLSTESISRTNDVFKQTCKLLNDRADTMFAPLRYIAWLLPTIGFIGTVVGISLALTIAASPPMDMGSVSMRDWMSDLTGDLAIAFNTTLVALVLSAVIVCLTTLLQNQIETALSDCEEYCVDNLINRLYIA